MFLRFTMAPKRKSDSSDGGDGKKRKAITMEVKLDIVKRAEMGETVINIGLTLCLLFYGGNYY